MGDADVAGEEEVDEAEAVVDDGDKLLPRPHVKYRPSSTSCRYLISSTTCRRSSGVAPAHRICISVSRSCARFCSVWRRAAGSGPCCLLRALLLPLRLSTASPLPWPLFSPPASSTNLPPTSLCRSPRSSLSPLCSPSNSASIKASLNVLRASCAIPNAPLTPSLPPSASGKGPNCSFSRRWLTYRCWRTTSADNSSIYSCLRRRFSPGPSSTGGAAWRRR